MSRLSQCCDAPLKKDPLFGHYCSHCIRYARPKPRRIPKKAIFFIIFLILLLFTPTLRAPQASGMFITVKNSVLVAYNSVAPDIELNDSSLTAELIKQDCILPGVALAQFKAETTYDADNDGSPEQYSSPVCKKYKNLAGIRFRIKGSAAVGMSNDSLHYVIYKSYRDCIKDYVRIQNSYIKKIDGVYAEDQQYIKLIKGVR